LLLLQSSYFDTLLGVETLCLRITKHFGKLDAAYAKFLEEYDGSYEPQGGLTSKNPWAFFLHARCGWSTQADTGKNNIVYTCIVLPTTVVRDFWLSPAVHIVSAMKGMGLEEDKLLEMILLGAYQTSWFRFN
jgi:hypothetical protein